MSSKHTFQIVSLDGIQQQQQESSTSTQQQQTNSKNSHQESHSFRNTPIKSPDANESSQQPLFPPDVAAVKSSIADQMFENDIKSRLWKRRRNVDVVLVLKRNLLKDLRKRKGTTAPEQEGPNVTSHTESANTNSECIHALPPTSSVYHIATHSLILAQNSTFFSNLFTHNGKIDLKESVRKVSSNPSHDDSDHLPSMKMVQLEDYSLHNYSSNESSSLICFVDISQFLHSPVEILWFRRAVRSLYTGQFPGIPEGQEMLCYELMKRFGFLHLKQTVLAYLTTHLTNPIDACYFVPEALKRNHMEIFEMGSNIIKKNAAVIFTKTNLIFQWDDKIFKHFIRSGSLNIDEKKLFDIAVRWCEQKAKERNISLFSQFKEIEEYIRYPIMSPDTLMTEIEPMGLVSQYLLEEAYIYNSVSSSVKKTLLKNQSHFRFCLRSSFVLRFQWEVDSATSGQVTVSNDGHTATLTRSGSICVFGDVEIASPGTYYWEVLLEKTNAGSCYVMVGVGAKPQNGARNMYLGNTPKGWALYLFNGTRYHNSLSHPYVPSAHTLRAGTRIGVVLVAKNTDTAELHFIINGKSAGRAFEDVKLPVYPSITLATQGEVLKLLPSATLPSTWKQKEL